VIRKLDSEIDDPAPDGTGQEWHPTAVKAHSRLVRIKSENTIDKFAQELETHYRVEHICNCFKFPALTAKFSLCQFWNVTQV
jgi:hypothetical protein